MVGRFTIMEARELTPDDLFTSGMVALTNAVDYGELLMEHVYPADAQSVPLMKQTLVTGLEIKLERTHDLSAVIHAERLRDGRVMITTVPLLYGSYTATRGPGTFSLEPPFELNLAAGWPLFKETTRRNAETQYASYRERVSPNRQSEAAAGLAPTPPPAAANELIRVEPAQAATAAGRRGHAAAGACYRRRRRHRNRPRPTRRRRERPRLRRPAPALRSWSRKPRRLRWRRRGGRKIARRAAGRTNHASGSGSGIARRASCCCIAHAHGPTG